MHKTSYDDYTLEIFLKSTLLKFKDLCTMQKLLLMYKAKNVMFTCGLLNLFVLNEGNSRKKIDFKVQKVKITIKQITVSFVGVKKRNLLDNDLKKMSKFKCFHKIFDFYAP